MRIILNTILFVLSGLVLTTIFSCSSKNDELDTSAMASIIYTYRINNHLDSAVLYCADIYNSALEEENLSLQGIIYETVGIANLEAENYHKAIDYFNQAILKYTDIGKEDEADNLLSIINDTSFKTGANTNDTLSFHQNLINNFRIELSGAPSQEEAYLLFVDMLNASLINKKTDVAYRVYVKFKELNSRAGISNYYYQSILLLAQCYWDMGLGDSIINLSKDILQTQNSYEFDPQQMENCHIIYWLSNILSGKKIVNVELTDKEEVKLIQAFLNDSTYKKILDYGVINLNSTNPISNSDILAVAQLLDKKQVTYRHSLNLALNKFEFKELTWEYLAAGKKTATMRLTFVIILFIITVGALSGYTLFLRWKSYNQIKENNANLRIQVMENEMTQYELNLLKTIRDVQTAERRKVAMDMHDGITNTLTGLSLIATNMQMEENKLTTTNKESWVFMEGNLKKVIQELRTFTHALNDTSYLPNGFKNAIYDYFQVYKKGASMSIKEDGAEFCIALSPKKQYQLFRIIQELTTNAIKHAGANNINILFCHEGQTIKVKYQNNITLKNGNSAVSGIGEQSIAFRLKELASFDMYQNKQEDLFELTFSLPV